MVIKVKDLLRVKVHTRAIRLNLKTDLFKTAARRKIHFFTVNMAA